jgi:hypothetical protein
MFHFKLAYQGTVFVWRFFRVSGKTRKKVLEHLAVSSEVKEKTGSPVLGWKIGRRLFTQFCRQCVQSRVKVTTQDNPPVKLGICPGCGKIQWISPKA